MDAFVLEFVLQVLDSLMAPIPSPHTVALQPARVLLEKAAKSGHILKFQVIRQKDQTFLVHAFIDMFLIARCFPPSMIGVLQSRLAHD